MSEKQTEARAACKCTFRTFMVGDGCEVCNPAKSLEYARETIADQHALLEEMAGAMQRLLNSDDGDGESSIALADDEVLLDACNDPGADAVTREQAAAFLQCRAVLAKWEASK